MSRIQKMIFEAVEAAEAGLKHSNVEEIQYRRKESPIPHQKCKNPLDFCSISDRSVPLGVALLPWVSITALASSGVKPTLGSKAPPSGTLLPEMEKKSSGFFISDEGKRHLSIIAWLFSIVPAVPFTYMENLVSIGFSFSHDVWDALGIDPSK